MPNKKAFFKALVILLSGVVLALVLLILNLIIPAVASLILIYYGADKMVEWNTRNYLWRCEKCKNVFEINKIQNLLGINGGLNKKLLYCDKCGKRRWCDAVSRQ